MALVVSTSSYLSKVKENRSANRFYDLHHMHAHLPFGFIRTRNFLLAEPGLLVARPRDQLRQILIPLSV